LDRLLTSIDALDGDLGSLQTSTEPIDRIADRPAGIGPSQT